MTASTTMTIRVSPETKEKLERIATNTKRSKSFLAAEAVSAYVDHELQIIEGINRGLADVEAGRVVPHEQVMAEAGQIIAEAKRKKSHADAASRLVGTMPKGTTSRFCDLIAGENPLAAERVAAAIKKVGQELGEFATGRPGRVRGAYEKLVPRLPFIIAYALTTLRARGRFRSCVSSIPPGTGKLTIGLNDALRLAWPHRQDLPSVREPRPLSRI